MSSISREVIRHLGKLLKRESEADLQDFDLNTVIADALHVLLPEAKKRQVTVTEKKSTQPLLVQANPVHIEQVILNLVTNSLDALSDVEPDARWINIRSEVLPKRSRVEVSVIDSGPGIPENKLRAVFDTFFTTKEQGTGLGLSVARTIVETYGGKIWAENGPLCGAAIRFTLPLIESGSDAHAHRT
jgi:signal transduction histidine kinase